MMQSLCSSLVAMEFPGHGNFAKVANVQEPGNLANLVVGVEILQDLKANPLAGGWFQVVWWLMGCDTVSL